MGGSGVSELPFLDVALAIADGTEAITPRIDALRPGEWDRGTRCPGWNVRDLAWHIAWGEGPGEVIRAAREGAEPPEYATSRMGPTPSDEQRIVAAMRAKASTVRRDMEALAPDDASTTVRYGRGDPGRRLDD
jgi:uncharacterized protein (TIGR03083 family)